MRRIVLVLALITGIVIGFGVPVSGLGLISVTLTCSDGTSVTMNVDTDTLNSLTDSVNAMTLYPAGLTCTLVQNPVNPLGAFFGHVATAASGDKFLVGGGRWQVPCSQVLGGSTPPPLAPAGVVPHAPPGALGYPNDVSPLADPEVLVLASLELHGKDAERERDQLARLGARVLAEELRGAHPLGGGLEQLADGREVRGVRPCTFRRVGGRFALAHCPAPGCSAACVRFCNASAWKYVRQAMMTSSMSPSITAARLCRVSPMR